MAVQSAASLGIHTDESPSSGVDGNIDEATRKNIWQTLFILDQFMAACLGRPQFIQNTYVLQLAPKDSSSSLNPPQYRGSPAIRAITRSCNFISIILSKAYNGKCLLNSQFQEIAKECMSWPNELDDKMRWRNEESINLDQKISLMHVNLFYSE